MSQIAHAGKMSSGLLSRLHCACRHMVRRMLPATGKPTKCLSSRQKRQSFWICRNATKKDHEPQKIKHFVPQPQKAVWNGSGLNLHHLPSIVTDNKRLVVVTQSSGCSFFEGEGSSHPCRSGPSVRNTYRRSYAGVETFSPGVWLVLVNMPPADGPQ